MLENFDQAKADLAQVQKEMEASKKNPTDPNEIKFLKSRALDLLKDIYVNSSSTLEHIKDTFEDSSLDEAIATISRALRVAPPLRRAMGSEDDSKTLVALIDSAIWRSKFVWACGMLAVTSVVIALAMLGINVADLNKQAEAAHKFLDEAKVNSERSLKDLSERTAAFDKERDTITKRIDGVNDILNNSNSEINKVIAKFNSEIIQLEQMDRDWSARRAALAGALALHDTFLIGKENEITQKTASLMQHASDKVTAIDATADAALTQGKNIQDFAIASKRDADAVQALVDPAQNNVVQLKEAKAQGQKLAEEIAGIRTKLVALEQDANAIHDRIKATSEQADKRGKEIEAQAQGAKDKLDATARDALGTVTGSRDSAVANINRLATETTSALNAAQTAAGRQAQLVAATADQVGLRSTDINRIAGEIGTLKTDFSTALEDFRTEEKKVKAEYERDRLDLGRAQEIIKILDDKKAAAAEQLHTLLDQRPDIDTASIWKLMWTQTLLGWLCVGALICLGLIVLWLTLLSVRVHRTAHRHAPGGATPAVHGVAADPDQLQQGLP